MENFEITDKDRVFLRIATALHGYADIDIDKDVDGPVLKHLSNLGLVHIDENAGFGTRQVRVYRRTRDERLKQAIATLKPVKL